jgi:hypothetical protein
MMSGGAPGTSGTAVTVSALTPAAVPAVTAASAPAAAGKPTSRNGWTEWKAPNGHTYYHNASTHTTQWMRPAEMEKAASRGAAAVAAAAGKPTTGNGMTAPQASSTLAPPSQVTTASLVSTCRIVSFVSSNSNIMV